MDEYKFSWRCYEFYEVTKMCKCAWHTVCTYCLHSQVRNAVEQSEKWHCQMKLCISCNFCGVFIMLIYMISLKLVVLYRQEFFFISGQNSWCCMYTEAELIWSACGHWCLDRGKSIRVVSDVETAHAVQTSVCRQLILLKYFVACCTVLFNMH